MHFPSSAASVPMVVTEAGVGVGATEEDPLFWPPTEAADNNPSAPSSSAPIAARRASAFRKWWRTSLAALMTASRPSCASRTSTSTSTTLTSSETRLTHRSWKRTSEGGNGRAVRVGTGGTEAYAGTGWGFVLLLAALLPSSKGDDFFPPSHVFSSLMLFSTSFSSSSSSLGIAVSCAKGTAVLDMRRGCGCGRCGVDSADERRRDDVPAAAGEAQTEGLGRRPEMPNVGGGGELPLAASALLLLKAFGRVVLEKIVGETPLMFMLAALPFGAPIRSALRGAAAETPSDVTEPKMGKGSAPSPLLPNAIVSSSRRSAATMRLR